MPTKVKIRPHRVFMGAKLGQAVADEVFQGDQSLLTRYGPIEVAKGAGVLGKMGVDEFDDAFRDGVRFVRNRLGYVLWSRLAKAFAVLSIKIPLAAYRFIVGFAFD